MPDDSGVFTAREWYEGLTLLVGTAAFAVYIFFFETVAISSVEPVVRALGRQNGIQVPNYLWWVVRGLPEAVFATMFGAIIGRIAWRQWRHFAVIFAVGFLVLPTLILAPTCGERPRARDWALWLLIPVVPFPFILLGAWCTSRPRRRRFLDRERNGFCTRCGYDLTGNVSGVCPECGTKRPNVQTSKSPNNEAKSC